jgi:hypothetical protein
MDKVNGNYPKRERNTQNSKDSVSLKSILAILKKNLLIEVKLNA